MAAGITATAAGLASYLAVDSGALGGLPGLLLFTLVLVLAPSHHTLARRLSINIALFLGWSQVLWWVHWPIRVDHAGVMIAVGAAVVVGAALRGVALRPSSARSDLVILTIAPVASAVAVSPWLIRGTPRAALEQMVPGVDNWAHFGMFFALRTYGAVPEALGPSPDGSGWGYDNYPKGFHAVVATLTEVLAPRLGSSSEALPLFLRGEALVVMLGVSLVVASVISLPGLRARPTITVPTLVLTGTALLWEPGQQVMANGFAAFWLGCVAAGAAILVAVRPRPTIADAAAVSGLLVLVCHCWLPLMALAAPACLLALIPHVGSGWSTRRSVGALIVLGLGAVGCLKAIVMLVTTVSVGFLVTEDGGYVMPALQPILVLLAAGCCVLVLLGSVPGLTGAPLVLDAPRRRLVLLTPIIGAVLLSALFVAQVRDDGTTKYYFVKLLIGYELVLVILVPTMAAVLIASVLPEVGRWQPRVAVCVLLCLVAPLAFGAVPPGQARMFNRDDPGTASIAAPYSRREMARGILAAASTDSGQRNTDSVYVALGPGNAAMVFYPDVWVHALNASVTKRVMARMDYMRLEVSTTPSAAAVVSTMLADEPDLHFLVPEANAGSLRHAVGRRWSGRIVAIPPASYR